MTGRANSVGGALFEMGYRDRSVQGTQRRLVRNRSIAEVSGAVDRSVLAAACLSRLS